MVTIEGKWYDGKSSVQINAVLRFFDNAAVRVERADTGEILIQQHTFNARISDRVADTPRFLNFPDGSILETENNRAVDQLLQKMNTGGWMSLIYLLETKKRFIVFASLLVILMGAAMVTYGFPMAAKVIVSYLPKSIFDTADHQSLKTLDKVIFRPSELSASMEKSVRNHLKGIMDTHKEFGVKLLFRKGGRLGPNAFALPGGTIVFTDELIKLAKHDDEILAIMVHEIGHLAHQHAMRRIVQDSLLSFALLALTGDASGVSEIFLGLPIILTEMAYSRDFEREADQYALQYMRTHNIPLSRFTDMLMRIENFNAKKRKGKKEGNKWMDYLSTHPSTKERVKLFRDPGSENN